MISTVFYERRKQTAPIEGDRRIAYRRISEKILEQERRRLASQIRRYQRDLFKIAVRLKMGDKEISGYTHDISSEGLLVFCDITLKPGTPMSLQFVFGENVCYLNVAGQVVFCRSVQDNGSASHVIGIKFSAIRDWEQKILISAVQELKQSATTQEVSSLAILISKNNLAQEAASLSIPGIGETERRVDTFMAKAARFYNRVEMAKSQGLYFYMRPLASACGPRVKLNGREMIMLGSYNYLGLTTHPKVKEATKVALEKFGVGAGGPRLLSGTYELHEKLEAKLARFKGEEACMVYNSGYVTNVGTIASLLERDDTVILDKKDHASIFDGSKLSRCKIRIFDHNNMKDLGKVLELCSKNSSRLIAVDSVFSMEGDLADLPNIYRLAKEYNAVLMIDEAHATGVLGKTGRGATEHFGLEGKIDIVMGTLSKALGGIGGFIVGSKELITYLKHHARSFVFSVALPPIICAALIAAIEVIESEPELRKKLWMNASFMRRGLQELGYNTGNSSTPIIPVIIGDEMVTYRLAKRLEEMGVFVSPVVRPAVDRGTSRLRVNVMATHTEDDLLEALVAFKKAGKELEII